jgi:hypothetical protein
MVFSTDNIVFSTDNTGISAGNTMISPDIMVLSTDKLLSFFSGKFYTLLSHELATYFN